MPRKPKFLPVGHRVGRLEVISEAVLISVGKGNRTAYPMRCDCGKEVVVPLHQLSQKRSCGCAWKEKTCTKSKSFQVGDRFGKLEITGPYFMEDGRATYPVKCDCGNETTKTAHDLQGHCRACGYCVYEYHDTHDARLYRIYKNMKQRCCNPNSPRYDRYGERGVSICEEWSDSFAAFAAWANVTGYADDLTIDRIDYNGNYEPDNCRWIPLGEQAHNRSITRRAEVFGETRRLGEWVQDPRCVVDYYTFYGRLRIGWHPDDALTVPKHAPRHLP